MSLINIRNLAIVELYYQHIILNGQARPGVLGIRYFGPLYFRYMVFFGQNLGIKYLVFPRYSVYDTEIYYSFFSFIMVLMCEMLDATAPFSTPHKKKKKNFENCNLTPRALMGRSPEMDVT